MTLRGVKMRAMRDIPRLILASTSRYRRDLLQRLRVPFQAVPPEVDETPHAGEAPGALAERLAMAKAVAVASRHLDAVVIGSRIIQEMEASASADQLANVEKLVNDIRVAMDA